MYHRVYIIRKIKQWKWHSAYFCPPFAFWTDDVKNSSLKKSKDPKKSTRALFLACWPAISSVFWPTAWGYSVILLSGSNEYAVHDACRTSRTSGLSGSAVILSTHIIINTSHLCLLHSSSQNWRRQLPATPQMYQMSYQINSLYFTLAHTAMYQLTSHWTAHYMTCMYYVSHWLLQYRLNVIILALEVKYPTNISQYSQKSNSMAHYLLLLLILLIQVLLL